MFETVFGCIGKTEPRKPSRHTLNIYLNKFIYIRDLIFYFKYLGVRTKNPPTHMILTSVCTNGLNAERE